jgi:RNA recognition motif-containing protein
MNASQGIPVTADNCLRNIIVNFLPPEWTEADLQKHFKTFGEIEQIKLVREKGTQNSKCFGFVVFSTPESAHQGIQHSNGMTVNGKRLKVALANPPNGHKNVNVYVCGVKKGVVANDIRELFAPFGNIENVNVLDQSRKGEAFIRYATEEEAERAIASLNGKPLVRASDNAVLCENAIVKYANRAKSKSTKQQQAQTPPTMHAPHGFQQAQAQVWNPYGPAGLPAGGSQYPTPAPTSVFVYNIPSSVDDQMLYLLFSMYGSIQSMNIMKNVDGTCKGYGFVNYWHYYEAVNAITNLNGFHLMNKVLQVRFKDPQKQRTQPTH